MIKILQFGEGKFLRTTSDYYFDTLNKEGNDFSVTIVKPVACSDFNKLSNQNTRYHVYLRGIKSGNIIEKIHEIKSVSDVIDPFDDYYGFMELAQDKDYRIIISNTTELGIRYSDKDSFVGFEDVSYPAKLTKFLLERFISGLDGFYILPLETVYRNGDLLKTCVLKYVELWHLSDKFKEWIETKNYFCNTCVDMLVSGFPEDTKVRDYIYNRIGKTDENASIAEVSGLWIIENKGEISSLIKSGEHGIKAIFSDNIDNVQDGIIKILYGSLLSVSAIGLWAGKETLYECMNDLAIKDFIELTMYVEILPFVMGNPDKVRDYTDSIIERFLNPYLNLSLKDIINIGLTKCRIWTLPLLKECYQKYGNLPDHLVTSLIYLFAIYENVRKEDGEYLIRLPSSMFKINDNLEYLEYFSSGKTMENFLEKELSSLENPDFSKELIRRVRIGVDILKSGGSVPI